MREFDWSSIRQIKENVAQFDESASRWFGHALPSGKRATRDKTPKASKIVEYWYRWGVLHCHVYGYPFEQLPAFVQYLMIDLGEPFCFACRIRYLGWDFKETKATKKLTGNSALYRHWNKLPLERAHIIPHARGGSNRLRNFVLLCPECHKEAPDVVNSYLMLKWLQNRNQVLMNQRVREWVQACLELDTDPHIVARQLSDIAAMYPDEFRAFEIEFSVNHWNTYSIASEVACIVEFARRKGILGLSDQ